MAIDWPSTLPQNPGSFSEQPRKIVVVSENDSGPTKTRARFTKAARRATMTFLLTIPQYLTFDTFFSTTLKGGALSMNFRHPWYGVPKEMYILEPPSSSDAGPLGVQVSMQVEYF